MEWKCLFRRQTVSRNNAERSSVKVHHVASGRWNGGDMLDTGSSHETSNQERLMAAAWPISLLTKGLSRVESSCWARGSSLIGHLKPSVATFLRNGIVPVGQKAVGMCIWAEAGKGPAASRISLPGWERDWFPQDVLQRNTARCFARAPELVDGLRMFLASFRLQVRAQQIDRILQAFSGSCGQCVKSRLLLAIISFRTTPSRR
jgi:hypothetical protein